MGLTSVDPECQEEHRGPADHSTRQKGPLPMPSMELDMEQLNNDLNRGERKVTVAFLHGIPAGLVAEEVLDDPLAGEASTGAEATVVGIGNFKPRSHLFFL